MSDDSSVENAIASIRSQARREALEAVERAIVKANDQMPGISTAVMQGDNLAIVLCTAFDDGEDPEDGEGTWSAAALRGEREVVEAIREHYLAAIRSLYKPA